MKKNYPHIFAALSEFVDTLDKCISDVRPEFDIMIDRVKRKVTECNIGEPRVEFHDNVFTMDIPSNLVAFCDTPLRVEAIICYYAMRGFVRRMVWDRDDDLDRACDALYYELSVQQSRTSWYNRLLQWLHIKPYHMPRALKYYTRFQQGKRIADEYKSLI